MSQLIQKISDFTPSLTVTTPATVLFPLAV
jgi:hypothetical protein